ncbi:MAG: urease accessory protein UreD [Rhodobacteraceae bacterium]|nr:urease accessory protein UreD [Paracoccaceae bacterium]
MLDDMPVTMQRSRGDARVELVHASRGTVLSDLRQKGSAKAFLPRTDGDRPEVVFLNTSGGLTGGDTLHYGLALGEGARAVGATQTAERGYRSISGAAQVTVDLSVGADAHLDWLPQETILFQGANLDRTTTVRLAQDATFLGVETLVLGRSAMGETVSEISARDRRIILRDGVPLQIDPLAFGKGMLNDQSGAGLSGATAMASLCYVAPDAEDRLAHIRTCLDVSAAASAWDGRLVVRALSSDAATLRRMLAGVITELTGRPLPRVWQV